MENAHSSSMSETQRRVPAPVHYLFTYVVNPTLKALLRSRFHGWVSKHLILLTFTGRKSGKQFTTPVAYDREGDTLYVATDSPWWKNLRGGAPVTVVLEGQERRGYAQAFADPERFARMLQRSIDENGTDFVQRRYRLDLDSPQPSFEELVQKSEGRVVIEIELEQG